MKLKSVIGTPRGFFSKEKYILAITQTSGVISDAAELCGVSSRDFLKAMHEHSEIAEAWQFAMIMLRDRAYKKLIECLDDGEPWAIRFLLVRAKEFLMPEITDEKSIIDLALRVEKLSGRDGD